MFTKENIKMKLFCSPVNEIGAGGIHFLEDKTNGFVAQPNIEVHDIKISNSSSCCVIAVFYTEKEDANNKQSVDEEKLGENDILGILMDVDKR